MTSDPLDLVDGDDEPVDPDAASFIDDRDDEPDAS